MPKTPTNHPLFYFLILNINENTLTGPANCKKTTRHHVHLSLCAKSRKTNDAKSRKWSKNLNLDNFLTISRSNIFKLRSYLVLTSGRKPKKSLEPFLRKISVSDFGLIWRPFRECFQMKNFFRKSGFVTFLPL